MMRLLANIPVIGAIATDVQHQYQMLRYILTPDPKRGQRLALIEKHQKQASRRLDSFNQNVILEIDTTTLMLNQRRSSARRKAPDKDVQ